MRVTFLLAAAALVALPAFAQDVGLIKVASGSVQI